MCKLWLDKCMTSIVLSNMQVLVFIANQNCPKLFYINFEVLVPNDSHNDMSKVVMVLSKEIPKLINNNKA